MTHRSDQVYNSFEKTAGTLQITFDTIQHTKGSIIRGVQEASLANADSETLQSLFGTVTLPAGLRLYRHYSRLRDEDSDYYMKKSGSGFFSVTSDSGRSIPDWVYKVNKPITLVNLQRMTPKGRLDIVPEFAFALLGVCRGVNLLHSHFDRGVTTCASGVKFQMTALQTGQEPEKQILKPYVSLFWQKMTACGMTGWIGADKDGRLEICMKCPIDANLVSFEKLWEEK